MRTDSYQQIVAETEAAVEQGLDNANVEWRTKALEELHNIATRMQTFTVNDFRERVDQSGLVTHDKRAMGGVMRTGVKLGWIEKTGQSIPSRVGHLAPLQIWRSKVYGSKEVHITSQPTLIV